MDLQELRRIREQERSADSLQSLREEFYADVAAYLDELTARRDQKAANVDDPFADPSVRRIGDELATAERTVEALYERRVGKIVKLASFAAADMGAAHDGLTTEERELFDAIVDVIKENRARILATLEPESPTRSPDGNDASGSREDATSNDADSTPDEDGSASSEARTDGDERVPDLDRTTVRITQDVGTIVGIDERSYDLGVDDIVTLPTKNAEPLLQREAAEPIE